MKKEFTILGNSIENVSIIFGILLYISDKFENTKKINEGFGFKSALYIGFFRP